LNKADSNQEKHGVSFIEAAHVFQDIYLLEVYDEAHSIDEERWKVIGMVDGIVLVVIHTIRNDDVIRLISARKGDIHERKRYQEHRNRFAQTIQNGARS
jgi:hypothetical protein